MINIYGTSTNTELQQRSVEYTALFSSKHEGMRPGLLERMPLIERSSKPEANPEDLPAVTNGISVDAMEDDLVDTEEVRPRKDLLPKVEQVS